ncbi:hypothetical protein [Rhodococcus koreensis]|uniref:hypothetical protein n=1 Tax=Rhodococcus koreensis TaxID=99653 RepID=UPI0036727644
MDEPAGFDPEIVEIGNPQRRNPVTMPDHGSPEPGSQGRQCLRVSEQGEQSRDRTPDGQPGDAPGPRHPTHLESWKRGVVLVVDDVVEFGGHLGLRRANASTSKKRARRLPPTGT